MDIEIAIVNIPSYLNNDIKPRTPSLQHVRIQKSTKLHGSKLIVTWLQE